MIFANFNTAIAKRFAALSKGKLFRVNVTKDEMWATYLASFPAGSDPIYRQRTEHDCNCCKQFIRAVGDVVGIIDGKIVSIWNVVIPGEPEYQAVADGMAKLCESAEINDVFLHYEAHAGTAMSYEQLTEGGVQKWDHFHVNIDKKFVAKKDSIGTKLNEVRSGRDVFARALAEIDLESVDTVLELIAQNTLYRGEEHKFAVTEFKKHKKAYAKATGDKNVYIWSNISSVAGSVARFRNSVIGTLTSDIAEGMELEKAVKSFESKVAPANYKRPTALVTKAMVDRAKATIAELGLTSALERRYATLADVSINNVLFANRATSKAITGDVFDSVPTKKHKKTLDKIEEISIGKFLSDVLPGITSLELMVENSHTANLVSLIAPVDPTAGKLFKWDNAFSWSYTGDVADSIKERVKTAGGNVIGDFCCRLAWHNHDDLDFHMVEPGGYEVNFTNKRHVSACGGMLDVDMNAGMGTTRAPVENIVYESIGKMKPGVYKLYVRNFSHRDTTDVGFEVEIDIQGTTYRFEHAQATRSKDDIVVATFEYTKAGGLQLTSKLTGVTASKPVWNIDTMQFVPVNAVMYSPNFWDEKCVGNKHYFFLLDGCRNDGTARGFYNEFLREDLNAHRKVIEIVGSKMRAVEDANQLSGVGFSTTQRNSVTVKATGAFTRVLTITF